MNKFKTIIWISLMFSFLSIAQAQTTHTWTGGDGNWATASKWDSGTVPGANDNVIFGNESYTVTINTNTEIGMVTFSAVSGKQILKIEGKKLTLNGEMSINDIGELDLRSGTEIDGSGFITNAGYVSAIVTTFNLNFTNNDSLKLQGISRFNKSLISSEKAFIHLYTSGAYITELALSTDFTNNGLIKFDTFYWGYPSKISLSSGVFTNSATGELLFTAGDGYYATHEIAAPVQNNGLFTVNESVKIISDNSSHGNNGQILLDGATFYVTGQSFENKTNAIIGGNGTLNVQNTSFVNNGDLNAGSAPGMFYIKNDLPMAVSSTLGFKLSGPLQGDFYNSFIITNLAKLNGSFQTELTASYVPNTGEEFVLAEYASREGSFLVQNGLDINAWKEFELVYGDTQLKLVTKDKEGQISPYASEDYATVLDGGEILIDVLNNDTDPDNETLNLISVGPARHGFVSILDGKARYISEEGYDGEDRFIYTIENVSGSRTSGLVNIQTNPLAPSMPVLASPADSSIAIGFDAKLYWYDTTDVDSYEVEISPSVLFNTGNEIMYSGVVDTFVELTR